MKSKYLLYITFFIGAAVAGCQKNYLGDGSIPEGQITEDQVFGNDQYARGVLSNAYSNLLDRYNIDGNGAMQASGTDEAVNSNLNSSINIFNNGTWSPTRTVDDVYSNMYQGLRKVNLFLVKAPGSAITPVAELATTTAADLTYAAQVARLRGEAFFLRAMFHFELVERYGSAVLATRIFGQDEELNLPRNTFDQCVSSILLDCDSAIARLPLYTETWNTTNRGRATQTAAMALKARMLLYAASPQYNPANDLTKWQKAADAAKAIIDLGTGVHTLITPYNNIPLFGTVPYNKEVIFATQATSRNDIEQNNAPISYDGALGRTNPTQEMVDAFEMKTTGRLISDPLSGYSDLAPYTNRDPRFDLIIFYNGRTYKSKTVDTYIGGKDGIGTNINATKTGYYLHKFFNDGVTWNSASNTLSRRPWVIFRYGEVLLNYAEALNEAQPGNIDVLTKLNLLRTRAGIPVLQTTNPTGNGYVANNQAAIRERIHNERRVELCFEGHRFFDIRRWKEGARFLNTPLTGMRITKNANNTFSYQRFQADTRVFSDKNYLYPISQTELNKAPALGQNIGY